jgi:type III secretory pathway component EscS
MVIKFVLLSIIIPICIATIASVSIALIQSFFQIQENCIQFIMKIVVLGIYYSMVWGLLKKELSTLIVYSFLGIG